MKNRGRGAGIGLFCFVLSLLLLISSSETLSAKLASVSEQESTVTEMAAADGQKDKEKVADTSPENENRISRKGIDVEFSARSLSGRQEVMQGDSISVSFRITDSENGKPVSGVFPGAWVDLIEAYGREGGKPLSCKKRVGTYLKGVVGMRPMVDLNSYYVLVMNKDATISVIDPLVGIAGITKLYAMINLEKPGADWVGDRDDQRLFVTMPEAGAVAEVDTSVFKVKTTANAGDSPVRIVTQSDEKYLWVGNNAEEESKSGVTVIDIETMSAAAHVQTGRGHHEIALTSDDRYAFVTNRDEGTVSVIDISTLKKVTDIKTGPLPISIAYSGLSAKIYVSDGKDGTISVVDPLEHKVVTHIQAKPGLGPLRFSQNERWGIVVNTPGDEVYIIDASTNRIEHTIAVGAKPSFTRAFGYIRSLGSERVSMINMLELEKGNKPPVVTFQAGPKAPELAKDIGIADAITEAVGEAAVLIVSPADNTVYYYMEGMNAPMGNFRNYGHLPRAVGVVDRALREEEPGVYSGSMKVPEAGKFEVAFIMDSPNLVNCFSFNAAPNPSIKIDIGKLKIEYLSGQLSAKVGQSFTLKFRLTDPETALLRTGLKDVTVLYYPSSGQLREEVLAKEVEDGVYAAELPLKRFGAYYVYVKSPSMEVKYNDLPYISVRALNTVNTQALKAEDK
jgi:YVTN family beta-propeller protein